MKRRVAAIAAGVGAYGALFFSGLAVLGGHAVPVWVAAAVGFAVGAGGVVLAAVTGPRVPVDVDEEGAR